MRRSLPADESDSAEDINLIGSISGRVRFINNDLENEIDIIFWDEFHDTTNLR